VGVSAEGVTTRAYSLLSVKAVDERKRTIRGIATTPETDRVGDIVESRGARFKNPMSMLMFHDHRLPVAEVTFGKATDDGIPFEATFPDPDDIRSVTLRERVLEAWDSVRLKLIKGVSIGFSALEDGVELMRNGGYRFTSFEILELSLVVVPANASATISTIKHYAAHPPALSGNGAGTDTTAVAGIHATARKGARPMKSITEQIADMEAKRAATVARMEEIQQKAVSEGRSKDDQEREDFDAAKAEIKSVDAELADLRDMEAIQKTAKPVADVKSPAAAAAARSTERTPVISVKSNVPKGIGFARAVKCQIQARMGGHNVIDVAKAMYPDHPELHHYLTVKATVPAGTTTQAVYASPLVYAQNLASEFIEYLEPMTILGKFGQGGVPSLSRAPFNSRVPSQTSGANAGWTQEGAGKLVTSAAFSYVSVGYHKVAAIAVLTKELIRLSSPSADTLIRNTLANAIVRTIDDSFIDPSFAAVTNVNPASITNGLTPQTSAGTSADNARTDIANLVETYLAANKTVDGLVFIMPPTLALVLSLMRNSLGQKEFPDITANGGFLEGFPVITSQHAANSSGAGNLVVLVRAQDIFLADDGNVSVDMSEQASVQMSDTPTVNSTTGTGASLVSLWQTNSVGIRAEREITWTKARTDAAVYMDDVNWGSVGSPA
jgi:HK97 family phage major capsid protein